MTDHYTTLGVNKQATLDEIKKAYRKLASQHHPDKGGSKEKFQEIQSAYAALSNEQQRAEYDNPQQSHWSQNSGDFHEFENLFRNFQGFGDIFGNVHQRASQPQRNRTLNLQTAVTLEDAFFGRDLVATIELPSGREQIINVKIPKGVDNGTVLKLQAIGDDSIKNMPKGDIHLSITIIPHSIFSRRGDDLIKEISINALDAILGTSITVDTIDGKTLNISIKEGTQPGTILSAVGYGMPNMHNTHFTGRLLLPVNITIPVNLTDSQKTLIKKART